MVQCIYCSKDSKVLLETLNASGDLKTVTLDCGHTFGVAVIVVLSSLSLYELKRRLLESKRRVAMRNSCKSTRESARNYIPLLEAELKSRRA